MFFRGLLLLACLSSLALAAYGPSIYKPKVIIKEAGPSVQYKWVGYTYHYPKRLPKHPLLHKWLPYKDPTYIASWVPHKNKHSQGGYGFSHGHGGRKIPHGFGPPKHLSVVGGGYGAPPQGGYGAPPQVGYGAPTQGGKHIPVVPHQSSEVSNEHSSESLDQSHPVSGYISTGGTSEEFAGHPVDHPDFPVKSGGGKDFGGNSFNSIGSSGHQNAPSPFSHVKDGGSTFIKGGNNFNSFNNGGNNFAQQNNFQQGGNSFVKGGNNFGKQNNIHQGGNSFNSGGKDFGQQGSVHQGGNSFNSGGNNFAQQENIHQGGNSFNTGGNNFVQQENFHQGGNSFNSGGNNFDQQENIHQGGTSFNSGGNNFAQQENFHHGGDTFKNAGHNFAQQNNFNQGPIVPLVKIPVSAPLPLENEDHQSGNRIIGDQLLESTYSKLKRESNNF